MSRRDGIKLDGRQYSTQNKCLNRLGVEHRATNELKQVDDLGLNQ